MTQYNLPADIVDIINELDKRVKELEKGSRAGKTAIDNGALEVRQDGVTKIKVGQLTDGSYGMAIYDDAGNAFPLSQLAFGLDAGSANAEITPARNTWVADTALSETVDIKNGRMIVIVSARVSAGVGGTGTPADGTYGWRATGPTEVLPDFGRGVYIRYNGSGMDNRIQASWVDVQEGLTNGTYVITPMMYSGTLGSPANDTAFAYRRLTVLPY